MDIQEEIRIQNDAIAKVDSWLNSRPLRTRALVIFRAVAGGEVEDPLNLRIFNEIEKSLLYDAIVKRTRP
jgi:hypothetical protein